MEELRGAEHADAFEGKTRARAVISMQQQRNGLCLAVRRECAELGIVERLQILPADRHEYFSRIFSTRSRHRCQEPRERRQAGSAYPPCRATIASASWARA